MIKSSILITGSSGFIGSHVFQLLQRDHVFDTFDRSKGYDISNYEQVRQAVMGKKAVLHFAAHAVGRKKMAEKPESASLDIQGLKHVTQACIEEGAFLVFPSSSLVYGSSSDSILTEESLCNPTDPYGQTKLEAENILTELGKEKKLQYSILRLSTTYGLPLLNHMVVSIFLNKALKNEEITITGPGTEKRNFVYIDDVVGAVKAVLNNLEKSNGQIFNVAGESSVSVKELAEIIVGLTGSKSKITTSSDNPSPHQIIGIEKIKKVLGWEPVFEIKEGIKEILRFFL